MAPNPASDQIRITCTSDDFSVLIVNTLGQTMGTFPVKGKEITITISDYKSGIYYVILTDWKKNVVSTEKLVKN